MKKLILGLVVSSIFSTSFAQVSGTKTYTVNGTFAKNDFNGRKIYLQNLDLTSFDVVNIDSTVVDQSKFRFTGSIAEPSLYFLSYEKENKPFVNLILESGTIEILVDTITNVKGTLLNDDLQALNQRKREIGIRIDSLETVFKEATDNGTMTPLLQKDLETKYFELANASKTDLFEFTKKNIKNPVGEFYFATVSGYFEPEQSGELIKLLRPEFKDNESVKNIQRALDIAKATQIGQIYTDVKLPGFDGKEIALSDYVGKNKAVLVDFWASWCGPCIKEMPNVVAAYAKFKDKGFEIVGISLDKDKSAWEAATKRLSMAWPQMSDLKGWESEGAALYGIKSIPTTLLLDKDGKIIAKNLRGDELGLKLSEILE
ncbi:MAG: redoxin domain-containing protein [Dysgonomonas sp.]